ncbi:MAG: diadenylate cyclase CdaA [Phycisphaerae bacterium]|nr:diadenylate cyclase CdaA [Phycisphaerae bacterium]
MSEFFKDYFRRFGTEAYSYPTVLIELLLIGAGVYVVMRFLRGTRGAGLVKGLGVLIVASFLLVDVMAHRFGWQRIEFLYTKYVWALIFAVLVIFQPELRRAVMRLGETHWLGRWMSDVEHVIHELVESVKYLSARKIGAIIAVERETGLGAVAETGTPVDAEVTADLLNTFFWPGSPLHDMGVIIRQGRVAAASCQFPLAEGEEGLPTELGSRHRAAIGLSQESDALIIIVSEETGTVSLANRGRLIRHLSPEELCEHLQAELQGTFANGKHPARTAPA